MKNEPVPRIQTTRYFNIISACLAFVMWGGWAFYVNSTHAQKSGVVSGVTQGTASFTITLLMVHAVTYMYHRFQKPLAKLLLPAIVTVSFTSLCLVTIHTLVGTPHVFSTIAPALVVAFSFCLYTSYKLNKISLDKSS